MRPRTSRRAVVPSTGADDRIAQRAYEIYLARGGADGLALDDWLQAEAELGVEARPSELSAQEELAQAR